MFSNYNTEKVGPYIILVILYLKDDSYYTVLFKEKVSLIQPFIAIIIQIYSDIPGSN